MRSAPPVSAFRDHYAVLGVEADATEAEIKTAFWELAKRYHPDVSGGGAWAAQRFADISEARSVLLSRSRRAAFDRERRRRLDPAGEVEAEPDVVAAPPPLPASRLRIARGLLLAGAVMVLVAVRLLPIASLQGLQTSQDVGGFDRGVLTGAVCCAACAVVGGVSWPLWRGSMSPGRWELLLGFLVLWLGATLAGLLDAHLLLGGLFSSDVSPASGSEALVAGVALMVVGAVTVRPLRH